VPVSSGLETVEVVEPWIWATLHGDAALAALVGERIVNALEDVEVATPYVVFTLASPRDIQVTGGVRTEVEAIYDVKAVTKGASWSAVAPIARRLDELLVTEHTVTTPTGTLTCRRDRIIQYPERTEGVQLRHLGGVYRIRASSTAD
jgi:hypothetical protein